MLLCMTTVGTAHAAVTKTSYGTTAEGAKIDLYTLKAEGIEASVTTFGARIVSIRSPDRSGNMANVVLGYSALDGYLQDRSTYFGSIVGRYGNRIAKGQFTIDGKQYQVPVNNGPNSLHGGKVGFDQAIWQAHEVADGVEMLLVSKDGDQGYPGALRVHVRYTIHKGALRIDYDATTDKTTVLNLTNHSYFNLAGNGKGTILHDIVTIPAEKYLPVDASQIPLGEEAPVAGTPFDFRKPTAIGARIDENNEQLKIGGGYDHTWVLGKNGDLKLAATVVDPDSGRVLTVKTTEPGVQFYTGNSLKGDKYGKAQESNARRTGFCFETQHFPDSPNHPAFPTTLLKPGETMHSTTIFEFSTGK